MILTVFFSYGFKSLEHFFEFLHLSIPDEPKNLHLVAMHKK
jgi:hypothetical protein